MTVMLTQKTIDAIVARAAASDLARYQWPGKGRAPIGYIKGTAVVYGLDYLKLLMGDPVAKAMVARVEGHHDIFDRYKAHFDAAGMPNDGVSDVDRLRHLHVVLIGLGIRESSGGEDIGQDRSAPENRTAEKAEAGPWQQSWDLRSTNPLIPKLFAEYASNPKLFADIFREGVHLSSDAFTNYGSGDGERFQALTKSCPAFAAEVAAIGLRTSCTHWGPINNEKVELRPEADALLKEVQALVDYQGRDTTLPPHPIDPGGTVRPPTPTPAPAPVKKSFWEELVAAIFSIFSPTKTPTPTPPPVPAVKGPIILTFTKVLEEGMTGPDVVALQQRLHQLGFTDLNVDGEFGEVTAKAVRQFQLAKNLDPDGEVGEQTIKELNAATSASTKPPLNPPSTAKYGEPPPWYNVAVKWLGWHEVGNNGGLELFIPGAKCGSPHDPYCAIFENFCVETSGFPGTRSAMARSFETSSNFIQLDEPALGCIVTMWRGSPTSGTGHVFLYDGENASGVRGIGANESDMIKRSFHDRSRIVKKNGKPSYWWPKSAPMPKTGKILVNDLTTGTTGTEV